MRLYSSLFQCLDETLPWTTTIIARNFLSYIPIINYIVKPVDKKIYVLRQILNQTTPATSNMDYLTYYKFNQNSLIFKLMNITPDFFSYSPSERNHIEKSKNLTNSDHQLTDLCKVMGGKIGQNLSEVKNKPPHEQGKSALSLVSREAYSLFQPRRLFNALLSSVAHGNQENAEKILKQYPELLMQAGTVTDYSGRTFKNISPFQYALWALDTRYMCTMMLDCLPQNEQGEEIRLSLQKQLLNHEQQGVCYSLENTSYQEKHYNFSSLINALIEYTTKRADWATNEAWDVMDNYWCQEVGSAQRTLPAHVAQHYCDPDKRFDGEHSFTEPTFKRTLGFHNLVTEEVDVWFSSTAMAGLGSSFAITGNTYALKYRPLWTYGEGGRGTKAGGSSTDLAAIITLLEVRTQDINQLKQRINTSLQKLEDNLEVGSLLII
ncbi:MAG: hypothetical protein LEGION0403_FIIPPAGN_01080 [Legionella sp.]|uniref:hypothetical protein n=1 Tax=Legionella sp. TaxID=459 RepID=UPI003D11296F